MAYPTENPPGYDYVVPPRVFAPIPNSGPRPFLGDDRSLFAPGTPDWINSRTNLVQAPPIYQEDSYGQQTTKEQGRLKNLTEKFRRRGTIRQGEPNWKPISLRAPFLLGVMLVSVALIAILQLLLVQSQQNGGVVFSNDVNSLPLKTVFPYLYLPTIIAVAYGFLWNWIDLDVRRIEPFLQLAQEGGATGQESLLLHYPVDFLASVPVKAWKSRHWAVFTASIATVFVFWGITPSQSGIFATTTLHKTMEMPSVRSTSPPSRPQLEESVSAKSAQSVVNIMWLNETLPPFMTRDYILAPFGPPINSTTRSGNWTASTLKYWVDVNCETPISYVLDNSPMVNSTWGCSFQLPLPDTTANPNASKVFNTMYAGYFNEDGLADYYLSGACPASESNSFLIQWSKMRSAISFNGSTDYTRVERLQRFNYTNLYCRSNYKVQEVAATVTLPDNQVLGYTPLGEVEALPIDLFNTSSFEASMSMGHERSRLRTDFPTTNWPSQTAFLANVPLDLRLLSTMAPFAIGASQLPLEEYLDPKKFADSYQSAYRLLFARQMVDILPKDLDAQSHSTGTFSYQTQSIVLVPAFTYIVECLLAMSIFFAGIILYHSAMRVSKLHADPATIAAVMSLAADDSALLGKLRSMDQASEKELDFHIRNRRFRLCANLGSSASYRLQLMDLRGDEPLEAFNDELQAAKRQQTMQSLRESDSNTAGLIQGLQPTEFRAKMGLAFLASQLALFVVIAVLFIKIGKNNGLPLPSQNQFIRQLVENYLPTAIGTFIEPFWVVLNRHLCFLQPFEELRRGRKAGKDSLNLEYSSLPPQLTVIKAWSNGNVLLGIVCLMALLANGLAISLSGLFFENTVALNTACNFALQYAPQFRPLDGEAIPFVVDPEMTLLTQKGQAMESAYVATSNRTAGTPLPPWTDRNLFYFPFNIDPSKRNDTWSYHARTPAIGAQITCQSLSQQSSFTVTGAGPNSQPSTGNLTVIIPRTGAKEVTCIQRAIDQGSENVFGRPTGPSAYEFAYALDGAGNSSSSEDAAFCREHIAAGWVRSILVDGVLTANDSTLDPLPSILSSHQQTIIVCRSALTAGSAEIDVTADGHILHVYSQNLSTEVDVVQKFLSTSPSDLVGQAHQIILDSGLLWHNDSLPSDFMNYLIEQATNSSSHLDPLLPPPSMESIVPPFSALYSQLFATLIGRNMDRLLNSATNETALTAPGFTSQPTIRIFISKPMFILAETILLLYIVVTVTLYLHRPWKILCRMPTSLASIIAFFAASHAIKDFRGTAGKTQGQLGAHMEKLDDRYGFGTYVGTDKKAHVGIEKYPFLAPLMKEGGGLDRQNSSDSKRSMRDELRSKFFQWKSGKVREGGWM